MADNHDTRYASAPQESDDTRIGSGLAELRALMVPGLTIVSMANDDLGSQEHPSSRMTFHGLGKREAQQVYTICQAQEQSWREKRRIRDLDELRAQSGGVQIGAQPGAAGFSAAASAGGDPTERLRRAKEMLDAGLITDTEYESIKARVVDAL